RLSADRVKVLRRRYHVARSTIQSWHVRARQGQSRTCAYPRGQEHPQAQAHYNTIWRMIPLLLAGYTYQQTASMLHMHFTSAYRIYRWMKQSLGSYMIAYAAALERESLAFQELAEARKDVERCKRRLLRHWPAFAKTIKGENNINRRLHHEH
ncbi:MAG: hypothetical protein WC378_16765, partial [Opitutaceae bacterium]